jgi:hypothetical protein
VTTQAQAENYYCDATWWLDSNIRSYLQFSGYSGTRSSIIGVALNGVPMSNGFSELHYDFIFPKAYSTMKYPKTIDIDVCFGNQLYSGFYHYYSFSPCILLSNNDK